MKIAWPSKGPLKTIPAVVEDNAQRIPDKLFLQDNTGGPRTYTFADMAKGMNRWASALQAHGLSAGDRVAILIPNSAELIHAFLGVQRCNGVPVIVYPPGTIRQMHEYRLHLYDLLNRAQVRGLIAQRQFIDAAIVPSTQEVPSLRFLLNEDALTANPDEQLPPLPQGGEALAHIQFTSGSTTTKKGVMVSHQNILDNVHAMALAMEITPEDRMVSWLPLAHDMGLIGATLLPLLRGFPLLLMLPSQFVIRPVSWLKAITEFRGTVTYAPNFGYQRCVSKILPSQMINLDLSTLRVAICGAEPVLKSTLEAFHEKFRPCGLRTGVVCPGYGLAEHTLGVSIRPILTPAQYDEVEYDTLTAEGCAIPASHAGTAVSICSVGKGLPGTSIQVEDEVGRPLPERIIGEIVVEGQSMALGYDRDPDSTERTFQDGRLHTGDYGYLAGGELFVTGRKKDIIINGGRNYYPQDFEQAVCEVPHVRAAVAFGVSSEELGTEQIVLLTETRLDDTQARESLIVECHRRIRERLGTAPDEVFLVPPHSILKTTSGKLRRLENKRLYLEWVRAT